MDNSMYHDLSERTINILDGYFAELCAKGEQKTVKEMSEEIEIFCATTIYTYIRHCTGSIEKKEQFARILLCTKFDTRDKDNKYVMFQQEIFDKLEKRKKAKEAARQLFIRQQDRKKENVFKK